jgi:hypothetical protein
MGLLIFAGIVAAMVVVIGFALYGVLLGMAALGGECKRLFWPELPDRPRRPTVARLPGMLMARAGDPPCWDFNNCLARERERCPAVQQPSLPCWLANMRAREGYTLKPECVSCARFSVPALLN